MVRRERRPMSGKTRVPGWIICIVIALAGNGLGAQELVPVGALREEARRNPAAPCLEPPPLVRWQDYHGPFQKAVGVFARKLERKAVQRKVAHPPLYRRDALLCSLETKAKFKLFISDTIEPASFLSTGFDAGTEQDANRDPSFGQGSIGYGKRFGVDFAGQTTSRFLKDFAFPTLCSEDPRYYRLGHGSVGKRLLHAAAHSLVALSDNGRYMFNFTESLGTVSAVALNNAYHSGDNHTFAAITRQTGSSVIQDAGFDVLREFWPQIARRLKVPFRDMVE
jgi:hypothetical protein